MILYDGSPFYPTAERFLEMLFKHKWVVPSLIVSIILFLTTVRITSFGAGPRYYSELQKLGLKPSKASPSTESSPSADLHWQENMHIICTP